MQDAVVVPLKQIKKPPPFEALKNRIKVGVIATGKVSRVYLKFENAKLNPPMPKSETAGLVSAWNANVHGSPGPVNALVGVDVVNVPLSV